MCLVVIALSLLPPRSTCERRYDDFIHNRVIDARNCVSLDQIGARDLVDGDLHWQWWRLTGDVGMPHREGGEYVLRFRDQGIYYTIRSVGFVSVDSSYDMEIWDRESFPVERRLHYKRSGR